MRDFIVVDIVILTSKNHLHVILEFIKYLSHFPLDIICFGVCISGFI